MGWEWCGQDTWLCSCPPCFKSPRGMILLRGGFAARGDISTRADTGDYSSLLTLVAAPLVVDAGGSLLSLLTLVAASLSVATPLTTVVAAPLAADTCGCSDCCWSWWLLLLLLTLVVALSCPTRCGHCWRSLHLHLGFMVASIGFLMSGPLHCN